MNAWSSTILVPTVERRTIGPLTLLLRRNNDEAQICALRHAEADEPEAGHKSWVRWIIGDHPGEVLFRPALPDRPVVVRPESEINLPAGKEAIFFVRIPLWAQLHLAGADGGPLFETPVAVLSNIWFGDPTSGELCYSVGTTARRELDNVPQQEFLALCPVHVKNAGVEALRFNRLCIRAPHLRLYSGSKHIWTEQVEVRHMGREEGSQVTYAGKAPAYESHCQLLVKEREKHSQVLSLRSFGYFKTLAGLMGEGA